MANNTFDLKNITGLTADSRCVQPGFLFAAIPGTRLDGGSFLKEAIARGASVILGDSRLKKHIPDHINFYSSSNPRKTLAKIASLFYDDQPKNIVAVTGTNGKTSVTSFYRIIMELSGLSAVSIGTPGIIGRDIFYHTTLTTPDSISLHDMLNALKCRGIEYVAIEASSHGLDMYRLDGLRLQAAAFTNLTHEHLDYHNNLTAYRACKLRLFEELLPSGKVSVVCSTAKEFDSIASIAARKKQKLISYGIKNGQLSCVSIKPLVHGFYLKIRVMGYIFEIQFPLIGLFQVENALGALALTIASGLDIDLATSTLSQLSCIPGRLDYVGCTKNHAHVYIDYAHTPDAIRTVLQSIRPHTKGRIIIVFGCGGGRDKTKRYFMGKMAKQYADLCIITDDNPRYELPDIIHQDIALGCLDSKIIPNRQDAIYESIRLAKTGDIILIAGKGDERYQIIQDKYIPCSDFLIVKNALEI